MSVYLICKNPIANLSKLEFPYTPQIDTNYRANYDPYDLTHSNFRGHFYQNSYVDNVNITSTSVYVARNNNVTSDKQVTTDTCATSYL